MPALPKQYTQQAGLPFFCVLKPFRQYVLAFLQHYAAKTLENVFGLGGPWAQQLATTETMHNLAQVGFALNGVGLGLSSLISTLRCMSVHCRLWMAGYLMCCAALPRQPSADCFAASPAALRIW